jgi:hypothetical protein
MARPLLLVASMPAPERGALRSLRPREDRTSVQESMMFAIPTYRLREVGEAVVRYDENLCNNGHSVPIVVFDDSTASARDRYFSLLEQTRTANEVFYVGPAEKARFLQVILRRIDDRRLESIVKHLFRPSYGGNRNFTVIYSLGQLLVSADDDMRPEALMTLGNESLGAGEICRGLLRRSVEGSFKARSFDVVGAFQEVLGRSVADLPDGYARGDVIVDSAMELETNASKGLRPENTLTLTAGPLSDAAVVKVAQTFRSGTNDIDAVDFIDMFLTNETQGTTEELPQVYVLSNFRPAVTKSNWRFDCGVAGYDNTGGLPPFFPTRLRFEDYIFRLWVQQEGLAAAHVGAAQHHVRSNYMRGLLGAEVFNEEICNLVKRKLRAHPYELRELTVSFDYEGEVSAADTDEILDRVRLLHARVGTEARGAVGVRATTLAGLEEDLYRSFYGFEPDFFHQNVARIVDDVVSVFRSALELWPTLIEICFLEKRRHGLPMARVKNKTRARHGDGLIRLARIG